MRNGSFAESLLALVTTRERARAIVGDLIEESSARGLAWYSLQVARVTCALFFNTIRSAPFACLGLGVLAFAVFVCITAVVFAASGLPWFPWHRTAEPEFFLRLTLVVVTANLLTGLVLGRATYAGRSALVALIAFVPVLQIALSLIGAFMTAEPQAWTFLAIRMLVFTLAFPLLYLMPLVLGGVLAQRRGARHRSAAGS